MNDVYYCLPSTFLPMILYKGKKVECLSIVGKRWAAVWGQFRLVWAIYKYYCYTTSFYYVTTRLNACLKHFFRGLHPELTSMGRGTTSLPAMCPFCSFRVPTCLQQSGYGADCVSSGSWIISDILNLQRSERNSEASMLIGPPVLVAVGTKLCPLAR